MPQEQRPEQEQGRELPARRDLINGGWRALSNNSLELGYAQRLEKSGLVHHGTEDPPEGSYSEADVRTITQDKRMMLVEALATGDDRQFDAQQRLEERAHNRLFKDYATHGQPLRVRNPEAIPDPGVQARLFTKGIRIYGRKSNPEAAEALGEAHRYIDTIVEQDIDRFEDLCIQRLNGALENMREQILAQWNTITKHATERHEIRRLINVGKLKEQSNAQQGRGYSSVWNEIEQHLTPARAADVALLEQRIEDMKNEALRDLLREIEGVLGENAAEFIALLAERNEAGTFLGVDVNLEDVLDEHGQQKFDSLFDHGRRASLEPEQTQPSTAPKSADAESSSTDAELQELQTEKKQLQREHEQNRLGRFEKLSQALAPRLPESVARLFITALEEAGFDVVESEKNESTRLITVYLDPEHASLAPALREQFKEERQNPPRPGQPRLEQTHPWLKIAESTLDTVVPAMRKELLDMVGATTLDPGQKRDLNAYAGSNKWHIPRVAEAHAILTQLNRETGKEYATYIDATGTRVPDMNVTAVGAGGTVRAHKTQLRRATQPNYNGFFSTLALSFEIPKEQST